MEMNENDKRLDRIEQRVAQLEIKSAVDFERHSSVINRLDKIDSHISKLVWLIITAILGAFMTFVLTGGFPRV